MILLCVILTFVSGPDFLPYGVAVQFQNSHSLFHSNYTQSVEFDDSVYYTEIVISHMVLLPQ